MSGDKTIENLNRNIFHLAHPAFEELNRARLHRGRSGEYDLDRPHSSQALAIDVFGSLMTAEPEIRNGVCDVIAGTVGVPPGGEWKIELEWQDDKNCLKEPRRSQIDAVARGEKSLIFFECKFTERDGGKCSQTSLRNGKPQCDGDYRSFDGSSERCALTEKGIRYWDVIPEVFEIQNDRDISPCPFAGSWYQWMRNIVLCHEVAKREDRKPAFIIAYADSPSLSVASIDWSGFCGNLRENVVPFERLSYQIIVDLAVKQAVESGSSETDWNDLKHWVDKKIENAPSMMNREHRRASV